MNSPNRYTAYIEMHSGYDLDGVSPVASENSNPQIRVHINLGFEPSDGFRPENCIHELKGRILDWFESEDNTVSYVILSEKENALDIGLFDPEADDGVRELLFDELSDICNCDNNQMVEGPYRQWSCILR